MNADASERQRKQPLVAAFGEWSQTNIGDHAIHEGVVEFFRDCGWGVDSYDFGSLRRTTGPLPGVTNETQAAGKRSLASQALHGIPVAKRVLRGWRQQIVIRRLMPDLLRCDAICVGGGALLTDSNLHFPQSLRAITWAACRLDKPVLCLGCSVEGDWSQRGRDMVRQFLRHCEFLAVRDRVSAERISHLMKGNPHIFGDFALPAAGPLTRHIEASRYLLAVNVTQVPRAGSGQQERYEDGVVRLVQRIMRLELGVDGLVIFTTGNAEDVTPATRVYRRLTTLGAELHPGRNLDHLRGILRSSAAVIAARLHAAIISLAEGVPVIGYSATEKIKNFFETVGLGEYSFSPYDSTDVMVNQLCRLLQMRDQFPASSCTAIHRTRTDVRQFLRGLAGDSGST